MCHFLFLHRVTRMARCQKDGALNRVVSGDKEFEEKNREMFYRMGCRERDSEMNRRRVLFFKELKFKKQIPRGWFTGKFEVNQTPEDWEKLKGILQDARNQCHELSMKRIFEDHYFFSRFFAFAGNNFTQIRTYDGYGTQWSLEDLEAIFMHWMNKKRKWGEILVDEGIYNALQCVMGIEHTMQHEVRLQHAWVVGDSDEKLKQVAKYVKSVQGVQEEEFMAQLKKVKNDPEAREYTSSDIANIMKELKADPSKLSGGSLSLSFKDLQWKESALAGYEMKHARMGLRQSLPKDKVRGISVSRVKGPFIGSSTGGAMEGLYEAAVLAPTKEDVSAPMKDWHPCYCTPITNDVIGHLTEEGVTQLMQKIELCDGIKGCVCVHEE